MVDLNMLKYVIMVLYNILVTAAEWMASDVFMYKELASLYPWNISVISINT